jgi:hypothetical protein
MRPQHLLFVIASVSFGQQPSGISPEWDVKANMAALTADVKRLEPLLAQVQPAEWVQRGAPEAYVRQLKSSQASVQNLIAATAAFSRDPDRLTVALDAFFRMEKMEMLLGSLKDGVRKYGSPDVANQMTILLATNSVHRDRLRQHVSELATAREQDFKIADEEAQRCRSILSRQGSDAKVENRNNRRVERR